MKNELKHSLNEELKSVRVDGGLKRRTLTEAAADRAPSGRRNFSLRPLAMAAALVIVIGLTAGVAALRMEHPDLSAQPQPQPLAKGKSADATVWARRTDGIYHADKSCPDVKNPEKMTLDEARASGMKGCWTCIDEGCDLAGGLVWIPKQGVYYHEDKCCSGMENALGVLEIEAQMLGRSACPVCAGGTGEIVMQEPFIASMVSQPTWTPATPEPTAAPLFVQEEFGVVESTLPPMQTVAPTAFQEKVVMAQPKPTPMPTFTPTVEPETFFETAPEETHVWMTKNGVYYHTNEQCSGMQGADYVAKSDAVDSGKLRCTVCMNNTVWVLDENVYYHIARYCSGMKDALAVSEQDALDVGKQPCPACIGWMNESSDGELWMTDGGVYYHTEEHCSGMQNAHNCNVTDALKDGKLPCPTCAKQFAEVWCAEDGGCYHLDEHCADFAGGQKMTGGEAVANGWELCGGCHSKLVQSLGGELVHHAESEVHHAEETTHHESSGSSSSNHKSSSSSSSSHHSENSHSGSHH